MRRVHVLTSVGLAAIVSALLYVYSGASHQMVWTYQQCVATTPSPCTPTAHYEALCGFICTRYETRLQQWVYDWMIESAVVAAFVLGLMPLTIRAVVTRR